MHELIDASTSARVEALLNPRNIVILGASEKPGNWAQRVWRNLQRYKFSGPVYPLNPSRDAVWNTRCYRSYAELPEPPDHVVVLIPAAFVPDALIDASRAGARSATVMTSGFGELNDAASAKLSKRLEQVIAETGLAVSGPNCLGNLNARASLVTMPDDRPQRVAIGPVAIVSQSGGIAMAIKRTLEERGVDSGLVVTSGNESGLSTAEYIAYCAQHPDVRVIVSYLESAHIASEFLQACRLARAAGKPVVIVKLGASDAGRAAALAHTGALAGAMEAFDAIAGPAGAMRVRSLDDIVEAVEYFVHTPLPAGRNLGGITFSGALRGLLLDAGAAHGLVFPPLAEKTRANLTSILSVGSVVGNPLDSGFAALSSHEAYVRCVQAMLDDPGVDILLLQEELPRAAGTERKEQNLRAVNTLAAKSKKPIVYVSMISYALSDYSRALRAELPHLSFLQESDKAIGAIRSIADYAQRMREPAAAQAAVNAKTATSRLQKILHGRKSTGQVRTLSEVESKALLKTYGIRGPREALARNEREAAAIARRLGYPVVAKAVAAALPHKSDVGAVVLGLTSDRQVRAAYRQIIGKVQKRTRVACDGVLIAQQISDGIELVLGATHDPEMGPVILFGAGGVDLELDRDVALAAPPLDERRAMALIARTRIARRIAGYRGHPALDRKALVKALIGLSHFVVDAGSALGSIDINPFLLQERGGVALDALVVLGELPSSAAGSSKKRQV